MTCKRKTNASKAVPKENQDKLPGIAIDIADNEKATKSNITERTHTLNNNPRTTDGPDPF